MLPQLLCTSVNLKISYDPCKNARLENELSLVLGNSLLQVDAIHLCLGMQLKVTFFSRTICAPKMILQLRPQSFKGPLSLSLSTLVWTMYDGSFIAFATLYDGCCK